jgi:hypothetical protein
VFFNNAMNSARVFEYDLSIANDVMAADELTSYATAANYSRRWVMFNVCPMATHS